MRLAEYRRSVGDAGFALAVRTAVRYPRTLRIGAMVVMAAALMVISTGSAAADPGTGSDAAMAPFDLTDTHGIKISQFELNIDDGGPTNLRRWATAFLLQTGWEFYRWWIGMIAWMLDWTVTFSWLDLITKPLSVLGDAIETNLIPSNLLGACVAACGVGIGIMIVRGRYGRAGVEFLVASAILALATTGLADPVGWVTAQGGPLYQARDAGIELANTVTSNGATTSKDPAALKLNTSGVLIDTFIRQPHQLINYGANIDGDATCVEVYDTALKAGPYGDDSAARDQIGKCNDAYKKHADSTDIGQLATQGFLMPTGGLLALVVSLLTLLLMASVALTGMAALKLIWHTIIGLVPGTARRGLAKGLADLMVHLFLIPLLLVFLCGYLFMLKSVMAANASVALVARFIIADLMLIVALSMMWRLWRNHKELSGRIAGLLNRGQDAVRGKVNPDLAGAAVLAGGMLQRAMNPTPQAWTLVRAPQELLTPGPLDQLKDDAGVQSRSGRSTTPRLSRRQRLTGTVRQRVEGNVVGRQAMTVGRDTVATSKVLGKVVGKTTKYTVGAPVSYPAAASKLADKWSNRSTERRSVLKANLVGAKDYSVTYAKNTWGAGRAVGKAVFYPVRVTRKAALKVGSLTRRKNRRPVDEEQRIEDVTPPTKTTKMRTPPPRPPRPPRDSGEPEARRFSWHTMRERRRTNRSKKKGREDRS